MSVVVIGAGMIGACTAYELTRRGCSVTLLDRGGVAEGTTGLGEGNVPAVDKHAGPELALTTASLAIYDELEALLGPVAGIRRKGWLIVHPDSTTWAREPARVWLRWAPRGSRRRPWMPIGCASSSRG